MLLVLFVWCYLCYECSWCYLCYECSWCSLCYWCNRQSGNKGSAAVTAASAAPLPLWAAARWARRCLDGHVPFCDTLPLRIPHVPFCDGHVGDP